MALTTRATTYLATLERTPTPSTAEVEAALRERSLPRFDSWLSFHERYAGYVEPLGRDKAVWGLIHGQGTWLKNTPDVDREVKEERWYVRCADVHPSYNYTLDHSGEFLAHPARTFDVKVERDALVHELGRQGRLARLYGAGPFDDPVLALVAEARERQVAEASDGFFRYFYSEFCVVVEDVELGEISEVFLLQSIRP